MQFEIELKVVLRDEGAYLLVLVGNCSLFFKRFGEIWCVSLVALVPLALHSLCFAGGREAK